MRKRVLPKNLSVQRNAGIEAFVEALHVAETHVHTVKVSDEIKTQYGMQPSADRVSRIQ